MWNLSAPILINSHCIEDKCENWDVKRRLATMPMFTQLIGLFLIKQNSNIVCFSQQQATNLFSSHCTVCACCVIADTEMTLVAMTKNREEIKETKMRVDKAEERQKVYKSAWKIKHKQQENNSIVDKFFSDNCTSYS